MRRAYRQSIAIACGAILASGCFAESFDPSEDGTSDGAVLDDEDTAGMDDVVVDDGPLDTTMTEGTETGPEPGTSGSTGDSTGDTDTGTTVVADDDTTTDDGETESSTGEVILNVADLSVGDLAITEVMWDPTCTGDNCEWFEVLNVTDAIVNLADLRVLDAEERPTDSGRIIEDLFVQPGGYVVLSQSTIWPYDFDYSATYGPNPVFNNSEPDYVVITNGDFEMLDRTPSLPFAEPPGRSWAFMGDPSDPMSNEDPMNWCQSDDPLPVVAEFGTPYAPTGACAP